MSEVLNVEEFFGENVFTVGKMKERLPKRVFQQVMDVMEKGGELSLATADVVAKAMKDWAVEKELHTILTGSSHLQALRQRSMMLLLQTLILKERC